MKIQSFVTVPSTKNVHASIQQALCDGNMFWHIFIWKGNIIMWMYVCACGIEIKRQKILSKCHGMISAVTAHITTYQIFPYKYDINMMNPFSGNNVS